MHGHFVLIKVLDIVIPALQLTVPALSPINAVLQLSCFTSHGHLTLNLQQP